MAKELEKKPEGYEAFIGEVKERIRSAQVRAALAVNRELVRCIGRSAATS